MQIWQRSLRRKLRTAGGIETDEIAALVRSVYAEAADQLTEALRREVAAPTPAPYVSAPDSPPAGSPAEDGSSVDE